MEWQITEFGNAKMSDKVAYRIDDMLDQIQEVVFDAGGLMDDKQLILNMPVSKLLMMLANNSMFMELRYRKPFEFKLKEEKETTNNAKSS